MAVLTKVHHDLFPNESASADDNDFHGCALAAPSGAEVEQHHSAAAAAHRAVLARETSIAAAACCSFWFGGTPQRNEARFHGIEDRTPAADDWRDDHQVSRPFPQRQWRLAVPFDPTGRGHHEPAVKVADKQVLLRDRCETAGRLLRRIGRAIEVPKILDPPGVEPRLNVAETATRDHQL